MPSGSKKRKAAKKKKEKEATTNAATHFYGDDDLKVIDEKENDGGEVCSPASQDHHNNGHPFAEGEEEMEKRDDTSSVRSNAAENEPVVNSNAESSWKVTMEENDVIQIDREVKPEDDSDSKNVESVKDSNGGQRSQDGRSSSSSSISSSSSSSDDESHIVEKNIVVIESVELETKEDTPNSVAECAAFDDPVKITDLPEVAQVTNDVLVMDAYDLAVGEPKDEANDPVESNDPSVILAKPAVLPELTQVTDVAPVIEAHSLVERKSTEEASHSVLETIPLVDSENGSIEVVHVKNDAHLENAMCSNVCDLGFKGNGKDECSGVSPVVMDMGSQPKEDKFSSTAVDNSAVSSVAAVVEAREEKDKLLLSSSVSAVDTTGGAEHIKDNVFVECSDSQPLGASARRPVQTTSWMSCCGLFEVFTGTSR